MNEHNQKADYNTHHCQSESQEIFQVLARSESLPFHLKILAVLISGFFINPSQFSYERDKC